MAKTLFLGDMEAQHKIWKTDLTPILETVEAVVQLGNLISCTRDARDKKEFGRNEAILKLWEAQPQDRSLRLAGSNEMAALNFADKWTNNASNVMLRDSWLTEESTMYVALSDKGRLVTHGGLTYGEWVAIGKPATAEEAAERLQEKYARTLFQGDAFLLDGRPNGAANPIWADAVMELYPSWILAPESCPFDQLHGGAGLNTHRARQARLAPGSLLFHLEDLSYRKFGSLAQIKDAVFRNVALDLKAETLTRLPADKSFYVEVVK